MDHNPPPATSHLVAQTHDQPSFDPPPPPPPPPSRAAPPAPAAPSAPPPPIPHHIKTSSIGAVTPWHLQTPPPELLNTPSSATADTNLYSAGRARSRTNSLVPPGIPSTETTITSNYRAVSSPIASRPESYHSENEMAPTSRRRSWMPTIPGKPKSRNVSQNLETHDLGAWVNAGSQQIAYNSDLLVQGERIPELWSEDADTLVYLFPRESGRGPQFKIYSQALSASQPLTQLMYGDIYSGRARGKSFDGRRSLTIEDATRNLAIRNSTTPPYTPRSSATVTENQSTSDGSDESIRSFAEGPKEIHLYFAVGLLTSGPQFSLEDIQKLVDARNLFAFLEGQPLVATPARPTNFRILLSIASYLKQLQFSNIDGSTFGEAVIASTNFILDDLKYADIRSSLEKTMEALILGENLKSVELYNEAFAHAAGKWDKIKDTKSPLLSEISTTTLNKLERAWQELVKSMDAVNVRLADFEFPSLFAGIGASTSSSEAKLVRFSKWNAHFAYMRKQTLKYYKHLHGSWPPKVNPKKNNFQQGGLNRLVLKGLYKDLCGVYDYLVDRTSLTSRGLNEGDDKDANDLNPVHAALRKLLGEYDRSYPPVKPPVPYDVPLVPDILTVEPGFFSLGPKDQNKHLTRSLKEYETKLVLAKSYNLRIDHHQPFLEMYKQFEDKETKGMSVQEMTEMRYGHWIFIYAVIQTLPLLVMDVPGLQYTEGVESFLCQPPLGGLPWTEDSGAVKMSWYGVNGGQGIVSMPQDVVNYGVEATYRRSHCWAVADKWLSGDIDDDDNATEVPHEELSPLSPPPGFAGGELGLRPSVRRRNSDSNRSPMALSPYDTRRSRSRQDRQSQRKSIALGLERLPIPVGEEQNFAPMPGYIPGSRPGSSGRPMSGVSSPINQGGSAIRASSHNRIGDSTVSLPNVKGSTFEDILGTMDDGKKKKKKLF